MVRLFNFFQVVINLISPSYPPIRRLVLDTTLKKYAMHHQVAKTIQVQRSYCIIQNTIQLFRYKQTNLLYMHNSKVYSRRAGGSVGF